MPSSFHTSCPGCLRICKSSSSYWQHLTQSQNPLCHAVFDELQQIASSDSAPDSEPESQDIEDAHPSSQGADLEPQDHDIQDCNTVTQEGPEHCNNAPVGPGLDPSDSELDADEQRLFEHDLEEAWEPERLIAEGGNDSNAEEEDDTFQDVEDALVEEYRLAGQRVDQSPRIEPYSAHHPRSHAGAILKYTTPTDIRYRATLNEPNNVWVPFQSEADWKIAKWAKLRGAGSTSFSELLAVDGVCFKHFL